MNTVIINGRITADPELRYLPNNTPVCDFSIAHNMYKKNEEGDGWDSEPHFFECTVFVKQAEFVASARKGDKIVIEGNLIQNRWKNKDGENRSKVKIKCRKIEIMQETNPADQGNQGNQKESNYVEGYKPSRRPNQEDDIPF